MSDWSRTLATARTLYALGEWEALCRVPTTGAFGACLQELLILKLHGHSQSGSQSQLEEAVSACDSSGVPTETIARTLLASAFNSLGRLGEVTSNRTASADFRRSIELSPTHEASDDIVLLRKTHQIADILRSGAPLRRSGEQGIFIDCGGYDGCSCLQFLMSSPHFDCVTFEPNPELWCHYRGLPTRLVKKAVYTYTGRIGFTIDPVDQDGSSVIPSKRVDYDRTVQNEDCPRIEVPCLNLSAFVRRMSKRYGSVVLKLDVEGAEYDILEKMLAEGTIDLIDTLFCEFHVGKMDVPRARHDALVAELRGRVSMYDWDALPWSFSRRETRSTRIKRKYQLVRSIMRNRAAIESLPGVLATYVDNGARL